MSGFLLPVGSRTYDFVEENDLQGKKEALVHHEGFFGQNQCWVTRLILFPGHSGTNKPVRRPSFSSRLRWSLLIR